MSILSYTYTLTNGTLADADQVMDNFNKISNVLNGNVDSTNVSLSSNWAWTGTHTFNAANLKIKGAGTGVASLQNANTASNWTITIPDPGASSTLIALAGAQTITGAKTFSGSALLLAGAGAGVATFLNANTSVNSNISIVYGAQTSCNLIPFELVSTPGNVANLSITVSGTTLTIKSGDGSTSLSAGNPGLAAIKSTTSGVTIVVSFTSNIAVTFGATSDTDGNLFGIAAADWANTMPFFLGIIYNGTTPYFCISRVPVQVSGSAATELCQLGDTDGDGAKDVMILTTGLTLANWVNLPITQVGWFKATFSNATSAWTFSVDSTTGFNSEYEKTSFTMPVAQNGGGGTAAAAGGFLLANGGTAPTWSSQSYVYRIDRKGDVTVKLYLSGDGGTDGAGAVNTLITVPYAFNSAADSTFSVGYVNGFAIGAQMSGFYIDGPTSVSNIGILRNSSTILTNQWQHSNFSNGFRQMNFILTYPTI